MTHHSAAALDADPAYDTGPLLAAADAIYRDGITDGTATQATTDQALIDSLTAQLAAANGDVLFTDPFTTVDPTHWNIYDAAGSYAKEGARDKRNVVVADGVLSLFTRQLGARTYPNKTVIAADGFTAAGYELKQLLTPGVRISFDLTSWASYGTRIVALTWPTSGWPGNGEIDFVEMGGITDGQSARTKSVTNNHYLDPSKPQSNGQDAHPFLHDFTQRSHVELTWLPESIIVLVDDRLAWCYLTNVPQGPMQLSFQTAVEGGGQSPTYAGQARQAGRTDIENLRITAV